MKKVFFPLIVFMIFSCGTKTESVNNILPGNDPNFKIISHNDIGFESTNRKVDVFGINIYAYPEVEDLKLLHAANIMAQYLDNDEDGNIDNPFLISTLKSNKACLFMWKYEYQININAQDLGADETVPSWHRNDQNGKFDASLEEIWHVITHSGYAKAYPGFFGENEQSSIAKAMDVARGGKFKSVPDQYPPNAWYTYSDESCEYECMVTEYIYWGMTSILGAQKNRSSEISQEWDLHTKNLVKDKDKLIYSLLTDPKYKFPKVIPDGSYLR
ncbi:MAG: hypothetical protein P8L83_05375 [Flavobacteriaceae bacterium]|nr:hypothetical protein [Flavobacteriaceae bacterium]